MMQFIRLLVRLSAFCGAMLLAGCSGYGGSYGSDPYSVYDNYGYPYYGYGYGNCCYDDDRHRPDRPDRREGTSFTRPSGSVLTRPRPSGGGMGRPAAMTRTGGGFRGR